MLAAKHLPGASCIVKTQYDLCAALTSQDSACMSRWRYGCPLQSANLDPTALSPPSSFVEYPVAVCAAGADGEPVDQQVLLF